MNQHPVILFDGYCNLCNSSVKFILKHELDQRFRFAALQSKTAKSILKNFPDVSISDSVLLVDGEKIYQHSSAALRIAKHLRWFRVLYFLIFFPSWLRDPLYRFIARNRYRWFGKTDNCMVPDESIRSRFLG